MNIKHPIFILLTLSLSGCAFTQNFPKDIRGKLQPINSQKVMNDVESTGNP